MGHALRILSANLWNGRADARAFAAMVEAADVDLVAVQECAPAQARALSAVFPHGRIEPSRDHMGMGIAMREPGEIEKIALPGRGAWRVRLEPAHWPGLGGPLDILNLHFAAPHTFRPRPGIWLRPRQLREFEAYLLSRPAQRCVAVGDFNSTPGWPLYKRIASQFTDAAVVVAREEGGRTLPTWGPWASCPRLLRIDHAFIRGVMVNSFQVVPVKGADHSAIVMDLSSE